MNDSDLAVFFAVFGRTGCTGDCNGDIDVDGDVDGSYLRPRELPDEVNCTQCHGDTPHDSRDINKRTARVNSTVCHIPYFAKVAPTDMSRDWSKPGVHLPEKGLYEPAHEKGTHVIPVYRFFNGMSSFYQFGDSAEPGPDCRISMSAPIGDIHDTGAKIFAFKKHLATQPIQTNERRLLPLKIGQFLQSVSHVFNGQLR